MIFEGFDNAEARVTYKKNDLKDGKQELEITLEIDTKSHRVTEKYSDDIGSSVKALQPEFKIVGFSSRSNEPYVDIGVSNLRRFIPVEPNVFIMMNVITTWPLMKALAQLEEWGIVASKYTITEALDHEYRSRPY